MWVSEAKSKAKALQDCKMDSILKIYETFHNWLNKFHYNIWIMIRL